MSELNIPGFIAFLRGEVTIDGHWFGGDGPIRGGIRRNFWWREHLPKLSAHIERQDAEIAQLRADLSESRRLLDDARAQKPVAFRYRIGGPTVEWRYAPGDATLTRSAIVESEPLYAAAPVPAQPASPAIAAYMAAGGDEERDPIERLRFYLSCALKGRDWHDVEPFIDAISKAQPAAVPEAVAKDAIPAGWVFYSADASIQSSDPRRPMAAMIKRDVDGVQWWLQLTEEEKEATPLYSSGAGMTLTLAIQNAVAAILSAADTEVKK